MPRTIIVSLAAPHPENRYTGVEYWSVTEDGRICDGLCWDEMIGALARITLNDSNSYTMLTLDQHKEQAKKRTTPTRMEDALRQLVAAFKGNETAGPLQAALQEAEASIEQADETDIPF